MKKFLSMIILTAIIFICGQNNFANAQDIWLYTDKTGTEYYLRECSLPARSWSFAHVVKVSGKNITNLAYRFEMAGEVYYSVCEGSSSDVFVSRESHPIIEKGTISQSEVAAKIWNNHLKQMENERWSRIEESERSGRERLNSSENEDEIFARKFLGIEIYVLPKTITRNSKGFSVDIKFKSQENENMTAINKYYFYNNGNINTDEKNVIYYVYGVATPGGLDNIQHLDSVSRPIYRICKKYL